MAWTKESQNSTSWDKEDNPNVSIAHRFDTGTFDNTEFDQEDGEITDAVVWNKESQNTTNWSKI